MRLPILYSVYYKNRIDIPWKPFDLTKVGTMIRETFKKSDNEKFPCIELTYISNKDKTSMWINDN